MNGLGLLERMKRWLAGKRGTPDVSQRHAAKRYTLERADATADLASPMAGAAVADIGRPRLIDAAVERAAAGAPATAGGRTEGSTQEHALLAGAVPDAEASGDPRLRQGSAHPAGLPLAPSPPHLDPLDPSWVQSLEDLPRRIAESAAHAATSAQSLQEIEGELEGHRLATRVIAASVRRLPELAASQADLLREANKSLEQQTAVLDSMLDSLAGVQAAIRTVDESSRRYIKAIGQLESSHREVLFEYQTLLLHAHRRLGRIAVLAVALAVLAIGGAGYALYLMGIAGQ